MRSDRLVAWPVVMAFLIAIPFSTAHADVWGDYANSYSDYMSFWGKYYAGSLKDAQKAKTKLDKQGTKLQNHLNDLQSQLAQEQATIASDQQTETAIENEAKALQTPPPPKDGKVLFIFPQRSDQKKALQDAEKRAAQVKADLAKVQQNYQNDETDLKSTNDAIAKNQASAAKAQAVIEKATGEASNYQKPAWAAQGARVNAEALFNQQKELGFDSQLLMTDLNSKKLQNKLSQVQIDALKQTWDNQLNNTLMGRYVNQQIEKAMAGVCDPQIQNACAAGKIDQLNKLLNTRLNAAKAGPDYTWPLESSSTAKAKNVSQPASSSAGDSGTTSSGTVH